MSYPWSHIFVEGDDLTPVSTIIPFFDALNERIDATGYFTRFADPVAGEDTWSGGSSASDPFVSTFGTINFANHTWKVIQNATIILARLYFTNHARFLPDDKYTDTDIAPLGSTALNSPNGGFTRKREPEISSLSMTSGFGAGDRARFTYLVAPGFSDFLGIAMPASSFSELQYSRKIMKMVSGAWTVDTDQTTPLGLWSFKGLIKPGDIVGKWIANELHDEISRLDTMVLAWRGFRNSNGGIGSLFSNSWPEDSLSTVDPLFEFNTRTGFSGAGPPYTTAAAATAAATSNWAANGEVTWNNSGAGNPGSSQGRQEYFYVSFTHNDILHRDEYTSGVETSHIRLNGSGFQGLLAGTRKHTLNSAVDIYLSGGIGVVGMPFGATTVYESRPSTLPNNGSTVPSSQNFLLFETLAAANTDSRIGTNWYGDDTATLTAPTGPEVRESVLVNSIVVQRFNVTGGFAHL